MSEFLELRLEVSVGFFCNSQNIIITYGSIIEARIVGKV